jgi:phage regulator Rha-like protein
MEVITMINIVVKMLRARSVKEFDELEKELEKRAEKLKNIILISAGIYFIPHGAVFLFQQIFL